MAKVRYPVCPGICSEGMAAWKQECPASTPGDDARFRFSLASGSASGPPSGSAVGTVSRVTSGTESSTVVSSDVSISVPGSPTSGPFKRGDAENSKKLRTRDTSLGR